VATDTPNIWLGLLGLLPLIVYIVLVFRDWEPLPATVICVLIGAVLTHQTLVSFGDVIAKAMGSFLALVGLIIMLGRGLGEVLTETKVAHTMVHKIIYGIGVDTEQKAMLGIMIACMVVVGLLGTMAGGNAIIAPIVLPIAAAVGLSPSVVGVIFQAVGETALILGPFTPPVVALLGFTNLSYGTMLLKVGIPVALITLVPTWFMLQKIQRDTKDKEKYPVQADITSFKPTPQSQRATITFAVLFLLAMVYGIMIKAGTSYVIVVMLGLALITGLVGGVSFNHILQLIVKGMAGNVGLFLLFILLEPFINFITEAGGFSALAELFKPLVAVGGRPAIVLLGGLTGAFGISGAVVGELKTLHEMFLPLLTQYNVSMTAWAVALVVATRVTNFIYPGANMFSSMGFAESKNVKSMIRNGIVVAICQTVFLLIYSFIFA
jgi:H+/gluconate symporter-like permease